MTKRDEIARDGDEVPKLDKEIIEDLDTPVDDAQGVRGGATLKGSGNPNDCCENETM